MMQNSNLDQNTFQGHHKQRNMTEKKGLKTVKGKMPLT